MNIRGFEFHQTGERKHVAVRDGFSVEVRSNWPYGGHTARFESGPFSGEVRTKDGDPEWAAVAALDALATMMHHLLKSELRKDPKCAF